MNEFFLRRQAAQEVLVAPRRAEANDARGVAARDRFRQAIAEEANHVPIGVERGEVSDVENDGDAGKARGHRTEKSGPLPMHDHRVGTFLP